MILYRRIIYKFSVLISNPLSPRLSTVIIMNSSTVWIIIIDLKSPHCIPVPSATIQVLKFHMNWSKMLQLLLIQELDKKWFTSLPNIIAKNLRAVQRYVTYRLLYMCFPYKAADIQATANYVDLLLLCYIQYSLIRYNLITISVCYHTPIFLTVPCFRNRYI